MRAGMIAWGDLFLMIFAVRRAAPQRYDRSASMYAAYFDVTFDPYVVFLRGRSQLGCKELCLSFCFL